MEGKVFNFVFVYISVTVALGSVFHEECKGSCPIPVCSDPVIPPGKCCPVCPDDSKPGTCPRRRGRRGACQIFCDNDGGCSGKKKCCSTGCGRECMILPGRTTCEPRRGRRAICAEMCPSHGCPSSMKCCSNGCGHECMPSTAYGGCPRRRGRRAICAYMCLSDEECSGARKCCSNGCGSQCMEPLG